MSATIYRVLQWCKLTPEEITGVIDKTKNGSIYKGEAFYNEVKNLGSWEKSTSPDDLVLIWNTDDTGPITIDGKKIGLFVHFDEGTQKFDWACTYEL